MIFFNKAKPLFVIVCLLYLFSTKVYSQKFTEELSANEVMELYLKTMLNANEESRQKLNLYLKPLYKGKDAFARPIDFFDKLIEDSQKSFLLKIDKKISEQIQPTLKSYYTTLFSLVKNSQCKVMENIAKENLMRLNYQCKYIVPQQKELLLQDVSKLSFQELKTILQKLQKDMLASQNYRKFDASFDLYIIKHKGKQYYFNNQPATLPFTLIDKFISDLEK